jgi:hypothetical protein
MTQNSTSAVKAIDPVPNRNSSQKSFRGRPGGTGRRVTMSQSSWNDCWRRRGRPSRTASQW